MYGKMSMLTYYFKYVSHDEGLMTTYSLLGMTGPWWGRLIGPLGIQAS